MEDIVLVGGGHAHLGILNELRKQVSTNQITLISASTYQYYSGMFSGYSEGLYSEEDVRINLEKVCHQADVKFVEDTIIKIDVANRKLIGVSGKKYSFRVVSFDIGSSIQSLDESVEQINIKPNFIFPEEINQFRTTPFPIVLGGGAAGVEMALSVQAWRRKNGYSPNVTIISSSSLLSSVNKKASLKIQKIVKQKGIQVYEKDEIMNVRGQEVMTKSGNRLAYSHIFPLTGPQANFLFKTSKVPIDSKGFLLVENTLQVENIPWLFGAGDCVSISSNPNLPKNGVYAVRQGPVLWGNINRYLTGEKLINFKPQEKFVSILSVGQNEGLFTYGDNAIYGKWAWRLKHWIDHQFMKKFK